MKQRTRIYYTESQKNLMREDGHKVGDGEHYKSYGKGFSGEMMGVCY